MNGGREAARVRMDEMDCEWSEPAGDVYLWSKVSIIE